MSRRFRPHSLFSSLQHLSIIAVTATAFAFSTACSDDMVPSGAADAGGDAFSDTSLLDAGSDVGEHSPDAAPDGGLDAGLESGVDSAIDASADLRGGDDAGADAWPDLGGDASADIGIDAGVDAGHDVTADTGADVLDTGFDDSDMGSVGLCPTDDWYEPVAMGHLGRVEPEDGWLDYYFPLVATADTEASYSFEVGPGCHAVWYWQADDGPMDLSVEGHAGGTLSAEDADDVEWLLRGSDDSATTFDVSISSPTAACEGSWTGFYVTCSFEPDACVQDEREGDEGLPIELHDGDSLELSGVVGLFPTDDDGYVSDTDQIAVTLAPGCTVSGELDTQDDQVVQFGWNSTGNQYLPVNRDWALTNQAAASRHLVMQIVDPFERTCVNWALTLTAECPDETPVIACADDYEPNDDEPFVFGHSARDYAFHIRARTDAETDPVDTYGFLGEPGCSLFFNDSLPDSMTASSSETGDAFTPLSGDLPHYRWAFPETGLLQLRFEDDVAACQQYAAYVTYSCDWTEEACSQDAHEADDDEGSEPLVVAAEGVDFEALGRLGGVAATDDAPFRFDSTDRFYADVPAGCTLVGNITPTDSNAGFGFLGDTDVSIVDGGSLQPLRPRGNGALLVHNRGDQARRYAVDVHSSTTIDQCVTYEIDLAVRCDIDDTPGEPVRSVDDLRAGELLVSEVLVQANGFCDDNRQGQYLELVYLGEGAVDLSDLYLHRSGGLYRILGSLPVVNHGERIVIGAWGTTEACLGVAEAARLTSLFRSDDIWTIANAHEVLDAFELTDDSPLVPWTNGVAWERDDLDPDVWCLAEDEVTSGTGLLGTPGAANGLCSGE